MKLSLLHFVPKKQTNKQTKTQLLFFHYGSVSHLHFFILFHVLFLHSSNVGAGLLLGANEIRENHFGRLWFHIGLDETFA
jgi:hypothetical protein